MDVLNKKLLQKHREANASLSDPKKPLVLFNRMTEIIEKQESEDPVLFIGFGKRHIGVTPNGEQATSVLAESGEKVDDEESVVSTRDVTSFSRGWKFSQLEPGDVEFVRASVGSAATNKVVGDVRIAAGVCLIIGGASTAKTPFAHAIASEGDRDYAVVRYGEPLAGYCLDPNEMAVELGAALMSYPDIVLDSVKDVLAFAAGGAMASGVSRGSFPILSDLSSLAAQRGATIYIPFNPSNTDERVIASLVEAARSNVTTTIVGAPGADPATSEWHVFTRRGEGLLRDDGKIVGRFKEGALVMSLDAARTKKASGDVEVKTEGVGRSSLVDIELEAVIRRSLNK